MMTHEPTLLIQLKPVLEKYNLKVNGIIHVGANIAQEYEAHLRCGISKFIYIEPLPEAFDMLKEKFINNNKVKLFQYACGEVNRFETMYLSPVNNGQSSSILQPKLHKQEHPDIPFDGEIIVPVKRLDDIYFNRADYNMLELDVQGYEDRVLRGAYHTLQHIDIINTEVNRGEVYEDCAQVEQLDSILYNFTRIKTFWMPGKSWGDAIYIKKELCEKEDTP